MKQRMEVSVSGGRTSAFMAHWLLQNRSDDYEFSFCFANTSREHPDTYRFLGAVNEHLLDGRLVCLEAEIHHQHRVATTHRVVPFDKLAKRGRLYEEMIRKYGIPNNNTPHCTRELKARVMNSYSKSLWGDDFIRAIGIRADESRRAEIGQVRIVYPLIDMRPTIKDEVLEFFKPFDWDLAIPEYQGNCVGCFKKNLLKLNAVWWDDQKAFDWYDRMERRYGHIRNPNFYRNRRTAKMLVEHFKYLNTDTRSRWKVDEDGACSESCEPFPMVTT